MDRQRLLVLAILFLAQAAFAYEQNLSAFGFQGLNLSSASDRNCQTITVDAASNATAGAQVGILSVQADFNGPVNDTSFVTVKINDSDPTLFWPENFSCTTENGCWARVYATELANGPTTIQLCITAGNETPAAEITNKSFLGFYDAPVLEIETNAPKVVILGDQVQMTTVIRNVGSSDANIFAQFIHPDVRSLVEITSFDIIEGQSSANALITAGQTSTFVYSIKPTKVSTYNLPSAVVRFDNIFGEKQDIRSGHPQMAVVTPKQLELAIVGTQEKSAGQTTFALKVLAKNSWDTPFEGTISVSPSGVVNDSNLPIIILPQSEKQMMFYTSALAPGKYTFSSEITDGNNIYKADSISFEVVQDGIPIEIVLSIIGVILAIVIVYWIYSVKKPTEAKN